MREVFKIIPHKGMSDPRLERRVIESNRDRIIYMMLLIGAILMLVALLW